MMDSSFPGAGPGCGVWSAWPMDPTKVMVSGPSFQATVQEHQGCTNLVRLTTVTESGWRYQPLGNPHEPLSLSPSPTRMILAEG